MAEIILINSRADKCVPFVCEFCRSNNWSMFIYDLPKRVVVECLVCEATCEMEIE